jgi:hypothetical protein
MSYISEAKNAESSCTQSQADTRVLRCTLVRIEASTLVRLTLQPASARDENALCLMDRTLDASFSSGQTRRWKSKSNVLQAVEPRSDTEVLNVK